MLFRIFGLSLLLMLVGCASNDKKVDNFDDLPPTAAGELALSNHFWSGLGGKVVRNLTRSTLFPDNPTSIETITGIDFVDSKGDKYGQRITALLTVETTGDYTFWVSADETAEVWLSSDNSPYNKKLIAFTNKPSGYLVWDRYKSQKSPLLTLQAGEQYFFEILHKEYTGADYLTVSWEGPDFDLKTLTDENLKPYSIEDNVSGVVAYSEGYQVGYSSGTYLANYDDTYPAPDDDGDGLPNFYEVAVGLDPNDITDAYSDVDGDLLTAYEEYMVRTDSNNADTDGDGMPDGFELVYGLNALNVNDASADLDGDGVSNLDEYIAGSVPDDSGSAPAVPILMAISLSWDTPLLRRDGSTLNLSDIQKYKIYYGTSQTELSSVAEITDPSQVVHSFSGLEPNTYYFAISTVTKDGVEGAKSSMLSVDQNGLVVVIEADPVIEPDPVVEADPVIEPDPVVEADPVIEPDPVVEADPVVEPDPVVIISPTLKDITLSWVVPTQREDGSALSLTDIQKYNIYYGTSALDLSSLVSVVDSSQKTYTFSDLVADTYYFNISTVTNDGIEGAKSATINLNVE